MVGILRGTCLIHWQSDGESLVMEILIAFIYPAVSISITDINSLSVMLCINEKDTSALLPDVIFSS